MNFQLTEERQMLQDGLRRYLRDTVTPDLLHEASEAEAGHSATLWQGLAEMGVIGALFSEEDGGFGGAGFDISVVFEEIGRTGSFEPLLESGLLAGGLLAALGSGQQRDMIEEIASGARILCLAHGEPRARYDLAHVESRAAPTDGGYTLTGRKSLVIGAPAATHAVISARTSGEIRDTEGLSIFLVPLDADGLEMRNYPMNGGGRGAEIALTDVTVPQDALIGSEGAAFDALETVHARASLAQCAEAVGLMDAIRELTIGYLQQRRQFGQPIGRFQALQHRMADMLIEIEQARSATINLAGHLESPRAERERHVSAAKNLVGRTARLVVEESIQMHGGIGMTMEYALGHLAKRLTMVDHRFGDADWHLERFIRLAAA